MKIFPSIADDKKLHFLLSFSLVIVLGKFVSPVVAVIMVLALGFLKEATDDPFDWYDILANVLGIIIALYFIK